MSLLHRRKRRAPFATPVRRRPGLDFSITGFMYCMLMLFMGLAAISSQANLLFGVFGLMIGILLISAFVNRWVLRRVTMRRTLPEGAIVGTPLTISYELRNEKRYWPSLSVTVAELEGVDAFTKQPQAYMLHAAPRMSAIVPAQATPKRRGLHHFGRFQLSTSFPFGFVKRALEKRQSESFLVYPALGEVDARLIQKMRSAERSGATMRVRRGGMDEFYGLKGFRTGENPRYIYWRRTARTGTIVAKEMTQVSPPRIVILVDTFLASRDRQSHENVERSIAMAASLASHALGTGLSVGLVAWTTEWHKIAAGRGKRHRRDVLSVLAQLPLNQSEDAAALLAAAAELQDTGATLVVFTANESATGQGRVGANGSSLLAITPDAAKSSRWFRFHPSIDFAHCMPVNQEPTEDAA